MLINISLIGAARENVERITLISSAKKFIKPKRKRKKKN
jgi:hypothetical protein